MFQYLELIRDEKNKASTIWMNRPDALNALSSKVLNEIDQALSLCENDQNIRVIVIRGKGGKAFISGSDIAEMSEMTPIQFREYSQILTKVCNTMKFSSKPTISAVEGVCFGGGNTIAAHSDFVIATEKSKFGQLEINVGIFGGVSRMISLVGERRAVEMCFLGKIVNADEAERIGLITKMVSQENFEAELEKLIKELSSKAPLALKFAKIARNRYLEMDPAPAIINERDLISLVFSSKDAREGLKAFVEKRKANYLGE